MNRYLSYAIGHRGLKKKTTAGGSVPFLWMGCGRWCGTNIIPASQPAYQSKQSVEWTKKRNTGFMTNILFNLLGIHDGESHREGVVVESNCRQMGWDGLSWFGFRAKVVQGGVDCCRCWVLTGDIGTRLGSGRRTLGLSPFSRRSFVR